MASSLRSKELADYFEVELGRLRPDVAIPCPINLIFKKNNHVLVWHMENTVITEGFITEYRRRGLHFVWIHKNDRDAFEAYLGEKKKEESVGVIPANKKQEEKVTPPPATAEGALIREVMQSQAMTQEEKKAVVAETARDVIKDMVNASPAQQAQQKKKARKIVQDVLSAVSAEVKSAIDEIMKIADVDPELDHAVNVSTFSVIFAMAFGRMDQALVGDLALAGLLHDIGLSQVPHAITQVPWKSMASEQKRIYAEHVEQTLLLLDLLFPAVSARAKDIILQHHEKFDGSGYPKGLQGFKLNDVAQLVAMSDLLDSVMCGRFDGELRPVSETFSVLEKMEKARSFPEHFNPEVFSEVVKWTKSDANEELLKSAAETVDAQAEGVIRGRAKAA